MKIVVSPDSFKGSLSSSEIISICEKVIIRHVKGADIIHMPIADGGEGTLDVFAGISGGKVENIRVTGPLGSGVNAQFGHRDDTFIVEMAKASGITLISQYEKNPLKATSIGTGEIIRCGLDRGYRKFIIGIGGSATNDGGTGMLYALGARFYDGGGKELYPNGESLAEIEKIDMDGFDSRIWESEIQVMCDVDNPLTGERGATYTYGVQKGADEDMLVLLEKGMKNFREKVIEEFGVDMDTISGAGAAGGMGGALSVFCGARLLLGIDAILEFADFPSIIEDADFVITGEGRIDSQSMHGKAVFGIAKMCREKGVPVYALCGGIEGDVKGIYEMGVKSIMPLTNRPMSIEEAIENSTELLEDAVDRMLRFIL
ncbi:glycerate kinase [Peptoclostridium litorale DSM 5388]|uniref:Glycerate kinase GlxK n=1 Tax=Peptoclostridium litorale DSM 5388 TaxID=1121324 RepID=A0A069RN40_PEPLI|nr:glycerate kinase [Peptoclostridium litorale]KDR95592.1 glycerate kinase GlxK [Peptoclostridium litorale DSM 5388]SIN98977.1 glycerate kinase [Peptoclostridium litorale DSM 5388]